MTPIEQLTEIIAGRGGVLHVGAHGACDDACCLIEAVNLARGNGGTDSPDTAGMPDLRRLNDASWSSGALRTEHCVPVAVALWDWSAWSSERRTAFTRALALATVRETLADLLDMDGRPDHAARCRSTGTLTDACAAAYAASAYAACAAADDACAAASAAYAACAASAAAAADRLLIGACAIWVRCATETEGL